jgi:hypothetical protein
MMTAVNPAGDKDAERTAGRPRARVEVGGDGFAVNLEVTEAKARKLRKANKHAAH